MLDAVELAVQWAAVSTCCEEIRVPAHLGTQFKYCEAQARVRQGSARDGP